LLEAGKRCRSRLDELGPDVEVGQHSLERDAVEGRVVDHELAEDAYTGVDEIRDRVTPIVGLVVVAATGAEPASAAITNNTFGATGVIRPGHHAARVTLVLGCEPGGTLGVTVTVTQGDTVAVGSRHGRCTGATETYAVTVAASNGTALIAGSAEICGEAATREDGVIDDTRSWCRPDGVDLHAG
jgi:hypothetical protein